MRSVLAATVLMFVPLAGCQTAGSDAVSEPVELPTLGKFNPGADLLISNFDSKPDVDDLHSIAALSTVLRSPTYSNVDYIAVAGAYGQQGGEYIDAPNLFNLAFGDNWLDAHNQRDETIEALANRVIGVLENGGHIWVQDAGQSDVSSDVVKRVSELRPDLETQSYYHVVQHSEWNESVTDPDKLVTLKALGDYRRIPDGNALGNGSPGYVSNSPDLWPVLLAHPKVGPVWNEAKLIADDRNPDAAYVNPHIVAGGIDFSDTAEVAYILGFDDMFGASEFVATFVPKTARME